MFYLSGVALGTVATPCISFGTWIAPDIPGFVPSAVYGASQTNSFRRRAKDEIMLELIVDDLEGLRGKDIITPLTTQGEGKCDENCSLIF